MSEKRPYPNASVMVNPADALLWQERIMMSLEEEGSMWRKLCDDLQNGRWDEVRALPFTGRIFKGTALRPSIAVCGSPKDLEIDHIHPVSRGGPDTIDNLQPLCRPCNRSKQDKTMEEWHG